MKHSEEKLLIRLDLFRLDQENIQDPFGQNKAIYQETFNELKIEIQKIINEVDNNESNNNR